MMNQIPTPFGQTSNGMYGNNAFGGPRAGSSTWNGWNYSGVPQSQPQQQQPQQQQATPGANNHFIELNWNEVFNAAQPVTSTGPSSFQIPTGHPQFHQNRQGQRSSSGIQVTGAPDTAYAVSFGNQGDQDSNNTNPNNPTGSSAYQVVSSGDSPMGQTQSQVGTSFAGNQNQMYATSETKFTPKRKPIKFTPCGTCDACKFQKSRKSYPSYLIRNSGSCAKVMK